MTFPAFFDCKTQDVAQELNYFAGLGSMRMMPKPIGLYPCWAKMRGIWAIDIRESKALSWYW
jgi:hypothetical protein